MKCKLFFRKLSYMFVVQVLLVVFQKKIIGKKIELWYSINIVCIKTITGSYCETNIRPLAIMSVATDCVLVMPFDNINC